MSTASAYPSTENVPVLNGDQRWINEIETIGAPDTSYADGTALIAGVGQTDTIRLTNYGFSITGTITGIELDLSGYASSAKSLGWHAQLVYNGVNQGSVQQVTPSTLIGAVSIFGGSTDVWGTPPLTAAQVNDSSFGVDITGFAVVSSNTTYHIDAAQIIITYGLTIDYVPPPIVMAPVSPCLYRASGT
jgi:hypothetical protein